MRRAAHEVRADGRARRPHRRGNRGAGARSPEPRQRAGRSSRPAAGRHRRHGRVRDRARRLRSTSARSCARTCRSSARRRRPTATARRKSRSRSSRSARRCSRSRRGLERLRHQLEQLEQRRDELTRQLAEGDAPLQALAVSLEEFLQQRVQVEQSSLRRAPRSKTPKRGCARSIRGAWMRRRRSMSRAPASKTCAWRRRSCKVRRETLLEQFKARSSISRRCIQELAPEADVAGLGDQPRGSRRQDRAPRPGQPRGDRRVQGAVRAQGIPRPAVHRSHRRARDARRRRSARSTARRARASRTRSTASTPA